MLTRSVLIIAGLFIGTAVLAEDVTVAPKGVYARIDTRQDIKAIQTLNAAPDIEKKQMAEEIIKNSSKYAPVVFFYLANYLCAKKDIDNAIFWLYAGRIRIRFDIARCTDQTVGDSIGELNASVSELLRLSQFENLDKTRALVQKAIAWDCKTPHDYDPKWIALHGMAPFLPPKPHNKEAADAAASDRDQ